MSDATKERIIAAATDLLFREGLYNVTYSQIAKKIGLSRPAVYKYFRDMDTLILESCWHWVSEARETIVTEAEALETADFQLRAYLKSNLIYTQKNRAKDALLLGMYYQALHAPKLAQAYAQMKTEALLRIKTILVRGNHEKKWKIKNPSSAAVNVHSLLVGEIIKLIIEPKDEGIETRVERVTQAAFSLVGHR